MAGAVHFPGSGTANFELRLYEGQTRFDVIYGQVGQRQHMATAGVQKDVAPNFTQYFCNGTGGAATGGQSYTSDALRRVRRLRQQGHHRAHRRGKMNRPWPMHDATRPRWRWAPTSMPSPGSTLRPITALPTSALTAASWTALAPIPVPHAQSRGTAVGTNIYVPGGFNSVSFGGPLDTMQIYNTTANTWSAGMTLPAARSGVATAAFNNLVYVIGGYNPVGTGHTDVYIYNPGTNSYTTGAPMPAGQGNVAGVLFNGEIYVVGGGTAPGAQYRIQPNYQRVAYHRCTANNGRAHARAITGSSLTMKCGW